MKRKEPKIEKRAKRRRYELTFRLELDEAEEVNTRIFEKCVENALLLYHVKTGHTFTVAEMRLQMGYTQTLAHQDADGN